MSATLVTLWSFLTLLRSSNWGTNDWLRGWHPLPKKGLWLRNSWFFPATADEDILQKSHSDLEVGGRGRRCHPMRSLKTFLYMENTFTFDDKGWKSRFFWLISLKKQSVKKQKRKEGKKNYDAETNNRDTAAFNFLQHAVSITRSFQMHQLSWGWEWPWISTSLIPL